MKLWGMGALLSAVMVLALLGQTQKQAAPKGPLSADYILKGYVRGFATTEELTEAVQKMGVDFLMTPDTRRRFESAHVPKKLTDAIDDKIRQQVAPPCPVVKCPEPVKCPDPPKEAPFEITEGPALSEREVVLLLQTRVSHKRVEQLIEKRGVDYPVTTESATRVLQAGGSDQLNGIIARNFRRPAPAQTTTAADQALVEAAAKQAPQPSSDSKAAKKKRTLFGR